MFERRALWITCRHCGTVVQRYLSQAGAFCTPECSQAWHRRSIAQRLPDLIDRRSDMDCWPFLGGKSNDGYGKIYGGLFPGDPLRHWLAHRATFALAHDRAGAEMSGVNVLHTCDNPPCCNPAHLWEGTHAENQADKVAKGRQTRGQDHWTRVEPERANAVLSRHRNVRGRRKLTEAQVVDMRIRYAAGGVSMHALAAEHNLHWHTVQLILTRKTWVHL